MANPRLALMEKRLIEEGGDDAIFDRLIDGETIKSVMKDYGFSRQFFYRWLKNKEGRHEAYKQAQELAADAHAEDGMDIVDEDALTPADVSRNRARADYRRWMARVRNPEKYGEKNAALEAVTSIGSALANALRQVNTEHPAPRALVPGVEITEEVDGELITDDDEAEDTGWDEALNDLQG